MMDHAEPYGGYGGPMRTPYGRMYGAMDFDDVSMSSIYILVLLEILLVLLLIYGSLLLFLIVFF